MKKFCVYIRVSTRQQGDSHLGLEAQLSTCQNYINSVDGELTEVFQDVQSGKCRTRPGLWKAIDYCKETGATLVFAKLDRLARDVEFTFHVINTGIDVYFCDMPVCNTMILGVISALAQYERELISSRTKAALQEKKRRGEKLGRPKGCKDSKSAIDASVTSRQLVARENQHNKRFMLFVANWERRHGAITDIEDFTAELNALGYKTARGMEFTPPRARAMLAKCKNLYI